MNRAVVAALLMVASSACGACGRQNFDSADAVIEIDAAPPLSNIAFVTSTKHAMTEFGSNLAGADAICNARAADAGLPGTYVAWLSTSTVSARSRLAGSRGWKRANGTPFTDRPEDLAGGVIYYPLALDEHGENVGTADFVITGTNVDGSQAANCLDWTTTTDQMYAGTTTGTTQSWTNDGAQACSAPGRIYCFGTGISRPLTFEPATGRHAFVSVQPLVPDTFGLAKADALCAGEASLAGLGGSYKALLATTSGSAISRFSLSGPTWVRVDGIPIADTPLSFVAGQMASTLNVTTTRAYVTGTAFSGAQFVGSQGGGVIDTCDDWTGTAGMGRLGYVSHADGAFFAFTTNGPCTGDRIYCLEE